ncbi:MarR family winged helix-turn-helix transcriptional regulator [Nocardia sp. NPDC101769]|uniref:MarR family winged helix-turn-helix transcriptional regulator n=1 Tax=Nocardia sp. NPDC101769 TaxID=3364333 RepID=UPI00380B3BF4
MARTDSSAAELSLLALLQRAVRWFQDGLTEGMTNAGVEPITPAHMLVLGHLRSRDPISIAELARLAGVTRQTMHRAVGQLDREGLVTVDQAAGYPRTAQVRITATGADRRTRATRILATLEAELGSVLGSEATRQLRATLASPWPDSRQ